MTRELRLWWACLTLIAAALALAACDSPSMAFRKLPATRVEAGGFTFSVRHTAWEAEVIRMNFAPGVRRRDVLIGAVEAIERTSGCAVIPRSVKGDTNIVTADLRCPQAPDALRPERPAGLDCVGHEAAGRFEDGVIEIACDVVRR